jgi:hypothetical protein
MDVGPTGAALDILDSLRTSIEADTMALGVLVPDIHAWIAAEQAFWDWVVFAMYSASYSLRRRNHHEDNCCLTILLAGGGLRIRFFPIIGTRMKTHSMRS